MDPPTRNRDQIDEEIGLGPDSPRRQRSSIPSFIFISFLFFMLTNHNEEDATTRFQYKDAIQALDYQMSNYSAWLNGTASNFSLVSVFRFGLVCVWQHTTDLGIIQPIRDPNLDPLVQNFISFGPELDSKQGSYYSNVSALFRGDIAFYNLTSISHNTNATWHVLADNFINGTNVTAIPQRLGAWNWTNTEKVGIKIHDRKATGVANVTEEIAIFHVSNSSLY